MRALCESCLAEAKSPCDPLPRDIVSSLGDQVRTVRVSKGESLFEIGVPCRDIFLLRTGLVRIAKLDPQKREHIISICGRGSLVGLSNLFTETPQTKCVALVTSEVCRLDRDMVMEMVSRRPEMMLWMLSASAAETERNMERVVSLALPRARERVAALILTLADLNLERRNEPRRSAHVVLHLSRQEMAQMIGISRQHFTLVLNELESEGAIRVDKRRLEIPNVARLEEMCGQTIVERKPEGERILLDLYHRRLAERAQEIPAVGREPRRRDDKSRVVVLPSGAAPGDAEGGPLPQDVALVNIRGVLDREAGLQLCDEIKGAIDRGARKFAVDLSGVVDFDSGGIGSLFAMAGQLKTASGKAILCGLPQPVRHALEVTKALALMGEASDRDSAYAALQN